MKVVVLENSVLKIPDSVLEVSDVVLEVEDTGIQEAGSPESVGGTRVQTAVTPERVTGDDSLDGAPQKMLPARPAVILG